MQIVGQQFVKAEICRNVLATSLRSRNEKSFDYRMRNISAVINEMGLRRVDGYAPYKNVGANVELKIKAMIQNELLKKRVSLDPTADENELDQRVAALKDNVDLSIVPGGVNSPKATQRNTTRL